MNGSWQGRERANSDGIKGNRIFKSKRDCVQFKELREDWDRLVKQTGPV